MERRIRQAALATATLWLLNAPLGCGGPPIDGPGGNTAALAGPAPGQSPGATVDALLATTDQAALLANLPFTGVTQATETDRETDALLLAATSYSFTISGQVVYNDRREVGHFDWRDALDGTVGSGLTEEEREDSDTVNYLGALDVVADFYELDSRNRGADCDEQQYLGSVTLDRSGRFSFGSAVSDPCEADGDEIPDIGISLRLRFCGDERCFSVRDEDGDTYTLWHRQANPDTPLEVLAPNISLSPTAFATDSDIDVAKAANLYASLVEATRVWHRSVDGADIPHDPRGSDGEVEVRYPKGDKAATAKNAHRIHFKQKGTNSWFKGSAMYHEYGHLIHMRAWNGSTGRCGDCPGGDYARDDDRTNDENDKGWSPKAREYPNSAFGEGWANFSSRVVQRWPRQYCGRSFDLNQSPSDDDHVKICNADPDEYPHTGDLVTHPHDGKSYPINVTKFLCDWYDDGSFNDDDPNMAGIGDHFAASLPSIWNNLKAMWDWVDDRSGLQVCDYIDYYLDGRQSASRVGAAEHDAYVTTIAELAYNNGLKCGLERPTGNNTGLLEIASATIDAPFVWSAVGAYYGTVEVTVQNISESFGNVSSTLSGPSHLVHGNHVVVLPPLDPGERHSTTFSIKVAPAASGAFPATALAWQLTAEEVHSFGGETTDNLTMDLGPDYEPSIAVEQQVVAVSADDEQPTLVEAQISCVIGNVGNTLAGVASAVRITFGKAVPHCGGLFFVYEDEVLGTDSIPSLDAGESTIVTQTVTYDPRIIDADESLVRALGIRCTVDSTALFPELSETNNVAAEILVGPMERDCPDLTANRELNAAIDEMLAKGAELAGLERQAFEHSSLWQLIRDAVWIALLDAYFATVVIDETSTGPNAIFEGGIRIPLQQQGQRLIADYLDGYLSHAQLRNGLEAAFRDAP